MNIQIEADSLAELKQKLADLLDALSGKKEVEEAPAKPARAPRKAKAKEVEVVAEPEVAPEEPILDEKPLITKEDAIDALKLVNEKFGLEKAKSILEQFGCARMSDLQEEQFFKFTQVCTTELQASA